MNFWGFTPEIFTHGATLFDAFLKENATNEKAEFYIPKIIDYAIQNNHISFQLLPTNAQWYGITYKDDFETVATAINHLIEIGQYPKTLR